MTHGNSLFINIYDSNHEITRMQQDEQQHHRT